MSGRKKKLYQKRFEIKRGAYWRFRLAHLKDIEAAIFFGSL